jgi:hypothetical protein
MGGQELSCCVGALARLGLPHRTHVPALMSRSSGRLARFRNRELLHLGWAAARLGYVPPPEWVREFEDETLGRWAAGFGGGGSAVGSAEGGKKCRERRRAPK